MQRQSIKTSYLKTICWVDNTIVDWASAGKRYSLDGQIKELFKYTFDFGDAAITSSDGRYAFIYKKLGTKGLLLKNGEILREINRSYYCAEIYEFPAAFVTVNSRTYLVHCPNEYCKLDFEDVETGEIITSKNERDPSDFFHSRLEISPGETYLMSKGWLWHPWDGIRLYRIRDCINNPKLLDESEIYPNVGTEISTASFITDNKVLIGSSDEEEMDDELLANLPPKHIAVWDIELNELSKPVKMNGDFGNLIAIDEKYAWDLVSYPKVIDIETGEIVDKDETIFTGMQKSSIIPLLEKLVQVSFNPLTKQLAIVDDETIEILEHRTFAK
jgi:hypothetical protein